MFVDVHAHLIHAKFEGEEDAVAQRALNAGLEWVIVNGLEPQSNRAVLQLCQSHSHLLPALGIYPVDSIANQIAAQGWEYDFDPPTPFDVDAEIDFIDSQADGLIAIGEIGLDQYWVKNHPQEQERVFRRLVEVALKHDKPIIIHTRKAEARSFEIIQEMGVKRANFHCYGGKLKLAKRIAAEGYYFSIPPVVERAESFQRLAQELPLELILSETDCPYMGPDSGVRNEPANIPRGVAAIGQARGIAPDEMKEIIRNNFRTLFRC
tara:strand:- start:117 stop:911 length:795 start_codon:yes stop_codon:yes gene_type:complete